MAAVVINGGWCNGDIVTIDCTVDAVRHRVICSRKSMEKLTAAQAQDFIARAAKALAAAPTPSTNPTAQANIIGSFTVGGTPVVVNGGRLNGDIMTIDCTVGGTHLQVQFDKRHLESLPTDALKQTFVGLQVKAALTAAVATNPTPELAVAGSLTV